MATGEKMVIVRQFVIRVRNRSPWIVLCRMGRGGELAEVGEGEDSGREVQEVG